ncbi:MAG TPA: hypothetical protein VGW35_01600 [Methylomirabilota bacterium]|jgi:hypothetical protein|nr:hypothetical protein [Methylomirabilota bacterium]
MRLRSLGLFALAGLLAVAIEACNVSPLTYSYRGLFPGIARDTEQALETLRVRRATTFNRGVLQISGQIRPAAPGSVPSRLTMIVRRKSAGGATLATFSFPMAVQSNGVIAIQRFAIPATVLNANDGLAFSFKPIGANLPLSNFTLNLAYQRS